MSNSPAANEKFIQYLNEALAMENAAVDRIRSRIDETPIDQSKQELSYHLEQTIQQQNRLKGIITEMSGQPTTLKAILPALVPMNVPMSSAERELLRTKEDAMIENTEVTSYKMLMQMAEKSGAQEIVPALQESLQEEVAMVNYISGSVPLVSTLLWKDLGMPTTTSASSATDNNKQQQKQSRASMAS
jgi:ferritin-like metal-binding protein YciE